jgi:mannose-1-phosphate guanylyltransferase/mannose-6-phosphate isomerase
MYPKQFISFFETDGPSLLGTTLRRIGLDEDFAAPLILCNGDHRFLIRDELTKAGVQPQAIILEPVARNTAAAVAVAALAAERQHREPILAVMPSDHLVKEQTGFVAAVKRAASIAATGKLALFGIEPDAPHTGYGYIRKGAALNGTGGYTVDAFVEKPNLETAKKYLKTGDYLWNSGIFVLHARTFLEELRRFAPEVLEAATEAYEKSVADLGFLRLDHAAFAASPNISVDYAVMEKTDTTAVVPLDVGWNDVGSWSSLWEVTPHDTAGNAVNGDALLLDTTDCYVHSDRSLVSMLGVSDLIVVNTPDALLVAKKDRSQDVSRLVATLKQSNRKEHQQHLRNARPWGYFETLSIGGRFQVKMLYVNPGAKLSLQMHHHRSEHWVVVRGTAKVTIGEVEKLVQENESAYITATQWHRLENPGKVPLEMIEVQIGSYLGEDDIIRSDDVYHRRADETK